MSQNDLRKAGGWATASRIAHLESGKNSPVLTTVDRLAVVLDTDPLALLADPEPCERCGDKPPAGFTCNYCGMTGEA